MAPANRGGNGNNDQPLDSTVVSRTLSADREWKDKILSPGPHDLRLAEALADQRLEAARRARVNMKRRPFIRRTPPEEVHYRSHIALHWPIHLHQPSHGVAEN